VVVLTIASIYFTYPQRDGQAELTWMAWSDMTTVYLRTVSRHSSNLVQCKVTQYLTMLPLCKPPHHEYNSRPVANIIWCCCYVQGHCWEKRFRTWKTSEVARWVWSRKHLYTQRCVTELILYQMCKIFLKSYDMSSVASAKFTDARPG